MLKAAFLTKPFLFLGFGFQDPNIELMLRLSRSLDKTAAPQHYAVIRRPVRDQKEESAEQFEIRKRLDEFRIADLDRSGIAVCLIDDHEENKEIVQALARRTREPAVYIAGSFDIRHPPDDHPQVAFSRLVGTLLAEISDVQIRSLAGASAVQVTEAFAAKRRDAERYDPAHMIYYFRILQNGTPPRLPSRTGTAVYTDLLKPELQVHVVHMCRLVIVIAGHRDTAKEAGIAMAAVIPVIPLPRCGGIAAAL